MLDRSVRAKIEGFIRRVSYDSRPAIKLVMRHIGSQNRFGNSVGEWPISPSVSADDIQVLVNSIEEISSDDAEGIHSGIQRYAILAEREGGESFPGRCLFTIQAAEDVGLDSEPPTKDGIVSQLMRHLEVVQRTAQMGTGHVIQMQVRTIEQLSEQLARYEAKHMETIATLESLKSEQHIRDLEAKKEEAKIRMMTDIANKVQALLPIVVNKLGSKNGQRLLPEKTTSGEQMVMALMESLTPEQMEVMSRTFTPEQMTLVMQTYETMQKRNEEINKEDKK